MKKKNEISDPQSCLNKAGHNEMIFVLLERDVAAPSTIKFWIKERLRLGKNNINDAQLLEAWMCASEMEYRQLKNEQDKEQEG